MLMKTPQTLVYLSAEELGITVLERAGLIEVRDDLASGRVEHFEGDEFEFGPYRKDAPFFDMRNWVNNTSCGTAHCIGGFMQARDCFDDVGLWSPDLSYLFYPGHTKGAYRSGPALAVRAIDAFLAGAGPDCWAMALADIPSA